MVMNRKKSRSNARNEHGMTGVKKIRWMLWLCVGLACGLGAAFYGGRFLGGQKAVKPVSVDPASIPGDADMEAGEAALRAGDPQQAIRHFNAAFQRLNRPEPVIWLARIFLAISKPKSALNAANEACKLAPDNAACRLILGKALEAMGQNDRAMSAYKRAAELDVRDPEPLFLLGLMKNKGKQTQLAVSYFQQALARSPVYAPAAHHLATEYLQTGEFARAESLLKRVLAVHPDDENLLLNLAYNYLKQGESRKAVEAFQRAMKILSEPMQKVQPSYHLGCAYDAIGQYDDAHCGL